MKSYSVVKQVEAILGRKFPKTNFEVLEDANVEDGLIVRWIRSFENQESTVNAVQPVVESMTSNPVDYQCAHSDDYIFAAIEAYSKKYFAPISSKDPLSVENFRKTLTDSFLKKK